MIRRTATEQMQSHSPTLGPEVAFATASGPLDLDQRSGPALFGVPMGRRGGPEPIVTGPLPSTESTRVRKSPRLNISSSVSTEQGFRTPQAGASRGRRSCSKAFVTGPPVTYFPTMHASSLLGMIR